MFRIRRVYDDVLPVDREALTQAQQILQRQIPGSSESDLPSLARRLRDPVRSRYRSILFVAERRPGKVLGFAWLIHVADEGFCYLDSLAVARYLTSGGMGGALYQRVRDEAARLESLGLFLEAGPDQPEHCPDPEARAVNARRLRFYGSFGARVVEAAAYQTPLGPGNDPMPLLLYDDLGSGRPLRRDDARRVARAVLQRRYGRNCGPAYIAKVLDGFREDPTPLRSPRASRRSGPSRAGQDEPPFESRVALCVAEGHAIHHVRERGYVEAPVRVEAILKALPGPPAFERLKPRRYGDAYLGACHDRDFLDYLRRACASAPEKHSIYPYVFPVRNAARPPRELDVRAGYFCIDTFTPLNRHAYPAARQAVDCALRAAEALLQGYRFAYALVRPPGHHAERRVFGGFCYMNSAAIAAQFLSRHGKVAVLDLDYHHGNGQQEIFYGRADVLTLSIHGHPRFAYPYFSGYEDERGEGEGLGFCRNYALPEQVDGERYLETLKKAISRVRAFRPVCLVVALGVDTARRDPTGTWTLTAPDFAANVRAVVALGLPTLVVQEGGYRTRTMGTNVAAFFAGLTESARLATRPGPVPPGRPSHGK